MKNKQTKQSRNNGIKAAAVMALALLALTGCPAEIEYRNVPGATEYINYSFSYGNIYVSFTDSAWRILNDSGKMDEFKIKIEELSNESGDWAPLISSYIKSKPRYEIIIADYNTDMADGEIVSKGYIISVNIRTTDPDIIQILRNRISGISADMRTAEGISMKAPDSNICMADAAKAPQRSELWRHLEQAGSRNAQRIAANSRSRPYGSA